MKRRSSPRNKDGGDEKANETTKRDSLRSRKSRGPNNAGDDAQHQPKELKRLRLEDLKDQSEDSIVSKEAALEDQRPRVTESPSKKSEESEGNPVAEQEEAQDQNVEMKTYPKTKTTKMKPKNSGTMTAKLKNPKPIRVLPKTSRNPMIVATRKWRPTYP